MIVLNMCFSLYGCFLSLIMSFILQNLIPLPSIATKSMELNSFGEGDSGVDSISSTNLIKSSLISPSCSECTSESDVYLHSSGSVTLLPEPELHCPNAVTLCIKLPDSVRIQRRFDCKQHSIRDVIQFVCLFLNQMNIDVDIEETCLSTGLVPMTVYSDHSLTLEQAGLTHNSILHFSYQ